MTGNLAFYFNWYPAAGQENFLLHNMQQTVQQGPHTTKVVWGAAKTAPRRRPRPRPGPGRAHKEMRNEILLQTTNYKLNQWDPEDRILRTDFNSDNQKIDTALAQCVNYMVGMICAWSGSVDAIPTGWALCDGTKGTPDLRGKFLLGAGGTYSPGATGGEATHRLTTSEMPSHTHTVTMASNDSVSGSHLARASTSGSYPSTTPHTSSAAGSGQAHNNMPPYYALCFVMYIGESAA